MVTGATGFLGGWLIEALLEKNHKVIALTNPNQSAHQKIASKYQLLGLKDKCIEHPTDLADFDAVHHIINHHKPDVVIHMAAIGDVTVSQKLPKTTFETSANSTLNILEVLRLSSPETLFLSHTTDKVYSGHQPPFFEDMPLLPSHIYELAKVTQEHLTSCYATQYGLKTLTVRCGNYFGGFDFNFNRIIPYTIKQLLHNAPIILRSKGNFTRDFLYIEDAVLINLMLIDRHLKGDFAHYGAAFNFSLEVQLSVLDLVKYIAEVMGQTPQIDIQDSATSEISDMLLSCQKSKEILDWQPEFSLEQGLSRTIDAYRAYFAKTLE